MNFVSVRIITEDPKRLVQFYESVTGMVATWLAEEFAELKMQSCTLAIASVKTLQFFGTGIALPSANRTVILEFRVDDVDASFERAKATHCEFVQKPTTMPWGNRSLLFRDLDGNLVNFFTPVTLEARKRFGAS